MLTTVFESFGYCRIGRLVAALKPINRINKLTTTDKTGRLMKISVHTIAVAFRISVARRSCRHRRGRGGGGRHPPPPPPPPPGRRRPPPPRVFAPVHFWPGPGPPPRAP